jgi:hypothetical protein
LLTLQNFCRKHLACAWTMVFLFFGRGFSLPLLFFTPFGSLSLWLLRSGHSLWGFTGAEVKLFCHNPSNLKCKKCVHAQFQCFSAVVSCLPSSYVSSFLSCLVLDGKKDLYVLIRYLCCCILHFLCRLVTGGVKSSL